MCGEGGGERMKDIRIRKKKEEGKKKKEGCESVRVWGDRLQFSVL
jgi:hypothetical protein